MGELNGWQPHLWEVVLIEARLPARVVELWPERRLARCRVGQFAAVWLPWVLLSDPDAPRRTAPAAAPDPDPAAKERTAREDLH